MLEFAYFSADARWTEEFGPFGLGVQVVIDPSML